MFLRKFIIVLTLIKPYYVNDGIKGDHFTF